MWHLFSGHGVARNHNMSKRCQLTMQCHYVSQQPLYLASISPFVAALSRPHHLRLMVSVICAVDIYSRKLVGNCCETAAK